MSAGKHNFTCEQGATFDRVITYRGSDGNPVDLSDYTVRMHVREYAGGDLLVALHSSASANGHAIISGSVEDYEDGANGNIRLLISAANTSSIPAGSLKYDLEIESLSGAVERLIEGKFNVIPEITR